MDERLLRPHFAKLPDAEKQIIMQQLAEKYEMELSSWLFSTAGDKPTQPAFSAKMERNLSLFQAIRLLWAGKSLSRA